MAILGAPSRSGAFKERIVVFIQSRRGRRAGISLEFSSENGFGEEVLRLETLGRYEVAMSRW
jgi:hypothetical protein